MMDRNNAISVIQNVSAYVTQVDERFLRLKSEDIEQDEYIQISGVLAYNALPRPMTKAIPNLTKEFCVNDCFVLDICRDIDHYVPRQINVMYLYRTHGMHLIGDGLLIDVSESGGPVIRCSLVNDFMCPKERCIISESEMRVGAVVTFEALVTAETIEGLAVRINSIDSKGLTFPVYRTVGIVQSNHINGDIGIRCITSGGGTVWLPIYESAYYGCGVPIKALVGESVQCVVCPSQPCLQSTTDLQVISFDANTEGSVPAKDRQRTDALDGAHCFGESISTRLSYRGVQCSQYFNEESMQLLRDAFLFSVDHVEPKKFQSLVAKCPKFVSVMMDELGIDDGQGDYIFCNYPMEIGGGGDTKKEELVDQIYRMPTAPDFMPDEVLKIGGGWTSLSQQLNEVVDELQAAAAGFSIGVNTRSPTAPDFLPEFTNTQTTVQVERERPTTTTTIAEPERNNNIETEENRANPIQETAGRKREAENSVRPTSIVRLAENAVRPSTLLQRDSIQSVGHTQISDWATVREIGFGGNEMFGRRRGNREMSIGKGKPG